MHTSAKPHSTHSESRNKMMLLKGTLVLILASQVTSYPAGKYPGCDRNLVLDRFVKMCTSYGPSFSSAKREANSNNGMNNGNPSTLQQQQPPYQYPQNYHESNAGLRQPMYKVQTKPPSFAWQEFIFTVVNKINFESINDGAPGTSLHDSQASAQQEHGPSFSMERSLHPRTMYPNEPEDFASFNDWFLKSMYADAEWERSIERWRRKTLAEEIWRFVTDKCCTQSGCMFPEDYYDLDKRINICGVR